MICIILNNIEEKKPRKFIAHLSFYQQPEGHFIEWKAEEFLTDTQSDEWDIVGPVGYRNDREADSSMYCLITVHNSHFSSTCMVSSCTILYKVVFAHSVFHDCETGMKGESKMSWFRKS